MKRRRNFNGTVGILTTLVCTLTTTTLALDENINYNSADENELIVKVQEGDIDVANPAIGEDYVLLNNYNNYNNNGDNNVENEPQSSEIVSGGGSGEGHQSEEEEEGPSSPNNNYSDEEDYYTPPPPNNDLDIEQYDEFNYQTYDHYASTPTYETYYDERDSPEFQQLLTADTRSGSGEYYHENKLDLEELSNEDMDSILNEIEVGRSLRAVHRELKELGLVNNYNEEDEEFGEGEFGEEGGFSPRRRKEQSDDIAKLTLDEHVNMILNQRYQERLLLVDKATTADQVAVEEEEAEGGGAFEAKEEVVSKPVVLKGSNSMEHDRGLRKKTMMKKGLG